MQNTAKTYTLADLIGLELPHGIEIIPTTVSDCPVKHASVDSDGTLTVWTSPTAPTFDGEKWTVGSDDMPSAPVEFVGEVTGYPLAAESLRRISPAALCVMG